MSKNLKRVAIYVPSLRGGGAERVMATVASELADRGYVVDLLMTRAEGPFLKELSRKVRIVDFKKPRMLLTLAPLLRYLRSKKPDVILSALGHTNIMTLVATMLARTDTRVVVSERGSPSVASEGGGISRTNRILTRIMYPKADAIITVSDGVGNELHELYDIDREKIHTIYNPVNINGLASLADDTPRHRWLDGHHQILLAVGRLTEVKDYGSLLTAFSLLAPLFPQARLIVLGEGPQLETLLQTCQELGIEQYVDFLGFQSNPYSWMFASDVYVLSSRSEGLPNAMIQAMASGLKIVSTNCKHGPSEILENGKWGSLVPVGDVKGLANAISSSLTANETPDVRERAKIFATSNIISKYAEVLGL